MDPAKQVLFDIVYSYQKLPGCRAITLVGSRARGTSGPKSSVDIMCVYFSEPDKSQRKEIAKKLSDDPEKIVCYEHPIIMDNFTSHDLKINVWHVSQDLICERVSTIEKQLRLTNPMLVASLHECKILWDPKNQLNLWKKQISPVPEYYKDAIIPQIFGEIISVIKDLSTLEDEESYFYFQHELIAAIKNIYELIFLLNGQYLNLTHSIDSMLGSFEKIPRNVPSKIKMLLLSPCTARGLKQKLRLLCEVTKLIGDILSEPDKYDITGEMEQLCECAPYLFSPTDNADTGTFQTRQS
ncbi:nucleotidyltransferase domain-containing protein [bacterium]|nr:nucleotidyltransferase domain-containing protein [candidate division CSSED10-310 bacterium]